MGKITVILICGWLLIGSALAGTGEESDEPELLLEQSLDAMRASNLAQANELIDRAHDIYRNRQDSTGLAEVHGYYSSSLRLMEQPDSARHHARRSIEIAERIGEVGATGRAHNNLGIICRAEGSYEKALEHYNLANEAAHARNDSSRIASSTSNKGVVYRSMGETGRAMATYHEALELAEKYNATSTKAFATGNLASLYIDLGDYERALEMNQERMALMEETGDRYSLPGLYNDIGYIYRQLGQYDRALSNYRQGLKYAEELGQSNIQIRVTNNIARVYSRLNQHDRAFRYYRANLENYDQITLSTLQYTVLKSFADALRKRGDAEEARSYYHRALSVINPLSSASKIMQANLSLANYHYAHERYDSSAHYADEALEAARQGEVPGLEVEPLLLQARIADRQGHSARRDSYLNMAQAHRQSYEHEGYTSPDFAEALLDLTDPEDPEFLEIAGRYMEAVEMQREYVRTSAELRRSYFVNHAPRYKRIAEAYLDRGEVEEAFGVIERARARVLIEEASEAYYSRDDIDRDENIQALELRQDIRQTYEILDRTSAEAARDSLLRRLDELKARKETGRMALTEEASGLKERMQVSPVEFRELNRLLDEETALLTYAEREECYLAIAVFAGEHEAWKIPIETDERDLRQLMFSFRNAIVEERPVPAIHFYGKRLAGELLGPAESIIAEAENLIINADGNLATMPFEALTWNRSYLINSYRVVDVPSVTALKLQDFDRNISYEHELFTLANPAFQAQELDPALAQRRVQRGSPGTLRPLPASKIEAERIGALFTQATLLEGEDASPQRLQDSDLSSYRFLHFATHGFVHREFPDLSGLALAQEGGEVTYFRSRDIASRDIPAEMVVLSACETAVGPRVTGEGILGLQRSFLIAGSRSVVSSLWRVYDESTSELMVRFYDNIRYYDEQRQLLFGWFPTEPSGTLEKTRAMRAAKIAMINSPDYYHPVHWAAFTVTGY